MAIEQRHDAFGIAGASWTRTSLDLPGGLSFDDWQALGWTLGRLRDMSAWALGDWLNYGEALYGEQYAQAVEDTGRAKGTLLEYGRVSRQVAPGRRRPELSFTHHQLVASRTPNDQDELLAEAEANGWSVEEFRGVLHNDALSARRRAGRAPVEVLELIRDIARAILGAATPAGGGYARVPQDMLGRLANALGEEQP